MQGLSSLMRLYEGDRMAYSDIELVGETQED